MTTKPINDLKKRSASRCAVDVVLEIKTWSVSI